VPAGTTASTALIVTAQNDAALLPRRSNSNIPAPSLAFGLCCFSRKKRRGVQLQLLAGIAGGVALCTGCGANLVSPTSGDVSTVAVVATDGVQQPSTSFTLQVL
jgi:hypothetical protein